MRLRIRPRFWLIVIAMMLIAFGASFAVAQHSLRQGSQALSEAVAQRETLQRQVQDLNAALEFAQTDEYVIRVARNELGLIMPGEIRYIDNH